MAWKTTDKSRPGLVTALIFQQSFGYIEYINANMMLFNCPRYCSHSFVIQLMLWHIFVIVVPYRCHIVVVVLVVLVIVVVVINGNQ